MKYFNVYALLNPSKPGPYKWGIYSFDFEPFYIGKGIDGRRYEHLKKYSLNKNMNELKNNIIRKIQRNGNNVIVILVEKNILEVDAFSLEKWLISKIGRRDKNLGPLANHTNGGDGCSGRIQTLECRKKKIEYWTNERRKQRGEQIKKYWNEENKAKRSEKYNGKGNPMYGEKRPDLSKRNAEQNKLRIGSTLNTNKHYVIKGKEYRILNEAVKDLAIPMSTIWWRCNNGESFKDWIVINEK